MKKCFMCLLWPLRPACRCPHPSLATVLCHANYHIPQLKTILDAMYLKTKQKTIVLLLLLYASVQAVHGQERSRPKALDRKITIELKQKSLKEALDLIASRAHIVIIYSSAGGKTSRPVSLYEKDQLVGKVLNDLLAPLQLTFEPIDGRIVIKPNFSVSPPGTPGVGSPRFSISGKVTGDKDEPLSGATIRVNGGHLLATAGNSGEFALQNIADGSVLQISFVGYIAQDVVVHGPAYLNIMLQSGNAQLKEVSVLATGYQYVPKERATGSFAQPVKTEFEDRVAPDVLSKLNGITSGLVFNANTTTSKAGNDINIRGRSTIFANDQPLIVVDNFPYNGDINNINPNDVESVTVLKDAAAASIWGVRAGNGVIVITTKKGKIDQPLHVAFNANITVFNKPDLNYNRNQLDAASYISLEQFLFSKGYYNGNINNTTTGPVISPAVQLLAANRAGSLSAADLNSQLNVLGMLNVNDQLSRYFYQRASYQQYSLSLSGGTKKAIYFFSAGFDRNRSGLVDNARQRITINSANTFYLLKNLELTTGVNIVQADAQNDGTLAAIQTHLFPYSQFAGTSGNPVAIPYQYNQQFIQAEAAKGFLDWSYIPLAELGGSSNTTKTFDARLAGALKYTFVKGLTAEVKYQYENTNGQNRLYQSQQTYYTRNLINQFSILSGGQVSGYNVPLGGILSQSNINGLSQNFRGTLTYNRTWTDHQLSLLAGYELSQVSGDGNNAVLYGYNDNLSTFTNINPLTSFAMNPTGSGTIPSGLAISSTLTRLRSSFANLAYTFRDRYTVSGSARVDGSNYFGVATNQKSVPLWSTGVKWTLDKEHFYNINWLPVLALRASYGYNGNLISSITGVTTFRYFSNAAYTSLNYAQISNIGNPDLRWEKDAIANIAVDFATKGNLISGSFDYFLKKGSDLLGFKTFPENTGITSLEGNYAGMTGKGFDLDLTVHQVNGALQWSTTFLLSHATDEVTHYDVTPLANQLVGAGGATVPNVGRPVYAYYGYRFAGLDGVTGNPIGYLNGAASQNYASIVTTTPIKDLAYIGPARPTWFGGLYNRFTYKNFALGIELNYKFGYYFMAPTIFYSQIGAAGNAFLKVNRDFNARWQNPGDERRTTIPSLVYPFVPARDQFYQYSTVNVYNAAHIRLQDISLSYTFNKTACHRLPFASLQLFAFANNIWLLWKANRIGLDPDAVPGIADPSTTYAPRSFSIGLKGSF